MTKYEYLQLQYFSVSVTNKPAKASQKSASLLPKVIVAASKGL
jgi:hypothetical protein